MQLSQRNLQHLRTSAPAGTQYPHFLVPNDCERYRITVRLSRHQAWLQRRVR